MIMYMDLPVQLFNAHLCSHTATELERRFTRTMVDNKFSMYIKFVHFTILYKRG